MISDHTIKLVLMTKNIPNLLSILRLLTIPIVAWLLLSDLLLYAALFTILIAFSDLLDGLLARLWNVQSELGSYLDAIADKAFVISIFILIGTLNLLPTFIIILVISRDIIIMGSFIISFIVKIEIKVDPIQISKVNTFFQFILVIITLLGSTEGFSKYVLSYNLIEVLIGIVMITTTISMFIYIFHWVKNIN